ncbi:SRPBCC family protein [Poritiphilus flavus]|uniref:Polyketide cyclase n=1 Tax=Poritiphilus flavus TaxID=2697053 RepID=A0A6L9EAW5_9FLAO|nr:SRPBCC family protein [Poritiphilus flavus]NAS11711.1 polyketide cyclase [Poritiphilus flavus]
MTTIIYILVGLVLLILLLAIIAPKNYDVNREIVINQPVPKVFDYLKYLKNQDNWSPWAKKDPNMKKEFSGTDGTVGAISKWDGNKDVGMGEQEITRLVDNEVIESQLRFFKPWKSQSDAYMRVAESGSESTKVTWGFSGKNKFPMSIMMLFMNMDKMVGKDFEEGLSSLKSVMEN